jgi:hypothetical protein
MVKLPGSLFEPKESMWPDCGDGHTYPVDVWPFYGGFEIVPEKAEAGLRPVREITRCFFGRDI